MNETDDVPVWVLKCRHCDLIASRDAEIGMLAEHFKAEHPSCVSDDGRPRLEMTKWAIHMPCDVSAIALDPGYGQPWFCPLCRATFDEPVSS